MSFEQRKEEKRKAIENIGSQRQDEEEEIVRIHEEKKNHPIFKEMREMANSAELREALLEYYERFKELQTPAEIVIYDDYDEANYSSPMPLSPHRFKNREKEHPFGSIRITLTVGDQYNGGGGDAEIVTLYNELSVFISAKEQGKSYRIALSVVRSCKNVRLNQFYTDNMDSLLDNIAERIVALEY